MVLEYNWQEQAGTQKFQEMTWIVDAPLNYLQKFCVNVLKCGPIPKHIAFIMDGNRRYATKANVNKFEGHNKGFDKLAETLQWCLELGITEVTVYAFSIENFKRSKAEVDALMKLAREKFQKLFDEKEKLMKEGVCIRVIGNFSLLPDDLRKLVAEAMMMTKNNSKVFLNVAFAYTSRDEMSTTMKDVVNGVKNNYINTEDITSKLFESCLFSSNNNNPDILVRTSGEVRFSDFLLWQITSDSLICFNEVLWPEFSIWHLLACVFKYQRNYNVLEIHRSSCPETNFYIDERIKHFIKNLHEKRYSELECYTKA